MRERGREGGGRESGVKGRASESGRVRKGEGEREGEREGGERARGRGKERE